MIKFLIKFYFFVTICLQKGGKNVKNRKNFVISIAVVMLFVTVTVGVFMPKAKAAPSVLMTAKELADKCYEVATEYKTLYVLGCFGAPMTDYGKDRYTSNLSYNAQPDRAQKINAATSDTFGFDCVCLIKGLLWGWNGNTEAIYGGAQYASNGVGDMSINSMLDMCEDVSSDFTHVEPGEILFCSVDASGIYGHVGVYLGDGLAVECTPAWKDCVQITAVANQGDQPGQNNRTWLLHGKLTPFLSYCKCESFNENGDCSVCEKPFDYESTKEDASGVYMLNDNSSLFETPYNISTEDAPALSKGEAVRVLGKYENAFGNEWYKVSYKGSLTGFASKESLTLVSENTLPSNLSLSAKNSLSLLSAPSAPNGTNGVKEVTSLSKEALLTAVSIVGDTERGFYYEAYTGDDYGFVKCTDVEIKDYLSEDKSVILGEDMPTLIHKAPYTLSYTVAPSLAKIKSVRGSVFIGTDTGASPVFEKTEESDGYIFELAGSSINKALKFDELSSGETYTLNISAKLGYFYYDSDSGSVCEYTYDIEKGRAFSISYDFLFPMDNGIKESVPYGESGGAFHRGIDINPSDDKTVYSAFEGVVYKIADSCAHVGSKDGCECGDALGNSILIKSSDGELCAIYGHIKQYSALVSEGEKIEKGQALATVGSSGKSEKVHLHFEVLKTDVLSETPINVNVSGEDSLMCYEGEGYKRIVSDSLDDGNYLIHNNGHYIYLALDEKNTEGALRTSDRAPDPKYELQLTQEDGYYRIKPLATKGNYILHSFIDKNHAYSEAGCEITLFNNRGSLSQRWIFEKVKEGYLIHPADTPAFSLTNEEGRLVLRKTDGADNQLWTLEDKYTVCDHAYGEFEVTKNPTCTEEGENKSTCPECGDVIVEKTDALGHDFGEWEKTTDDDGNTVEKKVCKTCGKVETREASVPSTQKPDVTENNGEKGSSCSSCSSSVGGTFVILASVCVLFVSIPKRKEK